MAVNVTILQGRLTADPELKQTASNVPYLEFTVAWSEKYKEVETKLFKRYKAWRSSAEFISKYFRKGQEVVLVGHDVTEEWETNGEKKSRIVCIVDKVNFCGPKASGSGQTQREQARNAPPEASGSDGFMDIPDSINEELPFS